MAPPAPSPDLCQGGRADDAARLRIGRYGRHALAASRHSSESNVDADQRTASRPPLVVSEEHVREHVERLLRPAKPHRRRPGRSDLRRCAARAGILHTPLTAASAGHGLNGWIDPFAGPEPRDVERGDVAWYDRGWPVHGALEIRGSRGHKRQPGRQGTRESNGAMTAHNAIRLSHRRRMPRRGAGPIRRKGPGARSACRRDGRARSPRSGRRGSPRSQTR